MLKTNITIFETDGFSYKFSDVEGPSEGVLAIEYIEEGRVKNSLCIYNRQAILGLVEFIKNNIDK